MLVCLIINFNFTISVCCNIKVSLFLAYYNSCTGYTVAIVCVCAVHPLQSIARVYYFCELEE